METPLFDTIVEQARRFAPLSIGIVDAGDKTVLEGVKLLEEEKFISPLLIGDPIKIRELSREIGLPQTIPVIPALTVEDAAIEGVRMVQEGRLQGLMKGHLQSDTFLHPILEGLREKKRLSHVFWHAKGEWQYRQTETVILEDHFWTSR